MVFALLATVLQPALPGAQVAQAAGTITGRAFRDFNSNGTYESAGTPSETGVSGVTVTAYDAAGIAQGTATTIADGTYSLSATGAGPYRIEFTNLPAGFEPSAHSTDSVNGGSATNAGSTVQFVADGNTSNVNLAINDPCDYCQSDPNVAVTQMRSGDTASASYTLKTADAIKVFSWSASGTSPSVTQAASQEEVGSLYGQAYNRTEEALYSAAFVKRHAGLSSGGAGQIFRTDLTNPASPGTPQAWVTIPNTGFANTNSARGLSANATIPSRDPLAMTAVGKTGLGDIDMSADGKTLYVMNLFDKSIYPVDTASGVVGTPIPVPTPACTDGVWRPFALGVHQGLVYAGGVCDASGAGANTLDLSMQVFPYDPVAGTWGAGLFAGAAGASLDYDGVANNNDRECSYATYGCRWNPWVDTFTPTDSYDNNDNIFRVFRPMPMLTDIEFDNSGAVVLGLRDRWGDLSGFEQCAPTGSGNSCTSPTYRAFTAGDILRATVNGASWTLETLAPRGTEFFDGEEFQGSTDWHRETAFGSLAYLPNSNQVATTVEDPFSVFANGLKWWNATAGGQPVRTLELFRDTSNVSLFGKANGLGDIEVLCDPAPIELGSRIWNDANGDGIQDPGEDGLSGVTVTLWADTT
ncbi:MAG: hypothetical protein KDD78_11105, partial [Caldilineaceae bacterium]|nr:hypothetical protein [Caldilineaceae bacterium]